jgi:type II secretory pathway component GspD/PulD (secretin)
MIKTKTRGRVIQSPQLIALDNEEATIQVGQLVRYAETIVANTEGGGNVGGFREAAGSPLKLGFQLLVIPHVTGPENNVLMTIIPKTENLVNFETFGDLRLPQTTQSIVVTKMMLRNGETGVIGGLKEESEDISERKVPIFGDIPFIGRLFRHRSKSTRGRNLMVFVTPTIIDFYAQDEFKKQMDTIKNDYSKPFTPAGDEETAQR